MTWRVTASLTTFLIAWILTVDILLGVSIGSIEVIAKNFPILLAWKDLEQYKFG